MHKLVYEFNRDVVRSIPSDLVERLPEKEESWLISAFLEELSEYKDAPTFVDRVDALIDIIYFAFGGLYRHGLNPNQVNEIFKAVHEANMLKQRGSKDGRAVSLSSDAKKPENWIGPEKAIRRIIYE